MTQADADSFADSWLAAWTSTICTPSWGATLPHGCAVEVEADFEVR